MREIKFRVWDKHVKKMGKVTEIIFSNVQETLVKYQYINDYGKTIDEQSHIDDKGHGVAKLLQYTGLKDKNGKEIYEGDIIDGKFTDIGVDTGLVVFKGYGFKLEIPSVGDDDLVDLERNCESIEVIGNIYENPELLEESK